jgi:lipopolysaccharide export system protein LptC
LASVYAVDGKREVAVSARSRGAIGIAYKAARRHSRFVRWLRLSVIAMIAVLLLTVVGANFIPPIGGFRLPGELGKLVIKGTKITMQQPRLAGYTSDARPYLFTADTAEQDITNPDFLNLNQPKARVEMADKSTVDMTAISGTYDMKTEMLTLKDNIHLVSSTGYEGRLSEAVIDVRKGNVVSEKPVWVKLLNGFLDAKRLEVVDNGALLRFGGGVSMTLHPDSDASKTSKTSQK